jgi:hypothetical protein
MIISKAVLWAIVIGFFVFTAGAIYLVNENVRVAGRTPVGGEVEVMDAW